MAWRISFNGKISLESIILMCEYFSLYGAFNVPYERSLEAFLVKIRVQVVVSFSLRRQEDKSDCTNGLESYVSRGFSLIEVVDRLVYKGHQ